MQLSAYAPLEDCLLWAFYCSCAAQLEHAPNESTRPAKFLSREGSQTWLTMGPDDAASADRVIDITLHRREIDLLKVFSYKGCGSGGTFLSMACNRSTLDHQTYRVVKQQSRWPLSSYESYGKCNKR